MQPGVTRIELLLTGMRSNSCREAIAEALKRVNGVRDVAVSLMRARAVVLCEPTCRTVELIKAVKAAGYGATLYGE